MEPLLLGLDIGTSSVRAIVFDARGSAVDGLRVQAHCRLITDPPGAAVMDADEMVAATAGCIDRVLRLAGERAKSVSAVGCCTFWHSTVGIDSGGNAVTPLITWADTRSQSAVSRFQLQVGQDYHERTGCVIHPSYFPARLEWLSREQPEMFRSVSKWLSPGEYLYLKLFGEARCSVSMASGTGLFNQNRCDWDDGTLAALPLSRENLAPLSDEPLRRLTKPWAGRWPALSHVPWVSAIGDGAASNLGSGCATDRRMAINLGTSGAIRVLWTAEHTAIPPELWCYRLDRKRFVMGAAFSDGGNLYAWMKKALALTNDEEVERELAKRDPDCHGLTVLPFLAGERSIGWRPDARATIHGLSLGTEPMDILQAGMEAIALRFALAERILRRQFPQVGEIIASGGALGESPVWAQMIADAIGRPIILSKEPEASSRGAAFMAMEAAGIFGDVGDLPVTLGETIEAKPARHEKFKMALERQEELYQQLATGN